MTKKYQTSKDNILQDPAQHYALVYLPHQDVIKMYFLNEEGKCLVDRLDGSMVTLGALSNLAEVRVHLFEIIEQC